jgi:membrane fusion protein (multidrug efflux system)
MRASQAAAAQTAQQSVTQIAGAQAGVAEAVGRLAQANTAPQQVAVSEAQAETAKANTEQLEAQVAQAELELSYTKVYAPENGRVTRKSVEQGALVQIGQPLLALVPGNVWVIANLKRIRLDVLRQANPSRSRLTHIETRHLKDTWTASRRERERDSVSCLRRMRPATTSKWSNASQSK